MHGDADNQVSFIAAAAAAGQATVDAFFVMDAWLTALAADDDDDRRAATLRTKPADLGDRCYVTAVPDDGACEGTFPRYASPRPTAGAPVANDVLQCALVPVDRDAYDVVFTDDEYARLESIFADGVCDWIAPPPNRVDHAGTWQTF